ncbi:hypothetical protein McanMca71_001935 [Microsporum canis]|uniref:Uncharacterized protein n=1 Tax=Arthroderma otae (strain ATCC MYA-4605 / CBS 113480) TaxID=554155 RepID=C5FX16_ARTOC|nr:conserved hypothetical protein [Microsporum canis CBS 113480]EEQ34856.1 conserved hypothetical protein [Microsporum canis CBS 113480]
MVEYIPPPEPRQLLGPLLACLPLGFASSRPPPVLLPLLSPVLRQRVQLLGSGSASSSESWLQLLCWGPANAAELERIVGEAEESFEPHPVSGEIEIPDDITITYRRFDSETLRCRLPLNEFDLTVVYVWCPADQEGGGPGWRVAEVLPLDALRDEDDAWFGSVEEANEAVEELTLKEALREVTPSNKTVPIIVQERDDGDRDDEDDYWAQYDNVQSRTPANGVTGMAQGQNDGPGGEQMSDAAYYNQYSNVQPALDNDDPTVDKADVGDTSLDGNTLEDIFKRQMGNIIQQQLQSQSKSQSTTERGRQPVDDSSVPLSHPRPASASSSNRSDAISKLEHSAECQSASEMAIRQHISTNVKSMFRLARASGMSRAEYQAMITRELDLLEMMENDD